MSKTGLEIFREATKVMIIFQGENSTITLKTLMKLIEKGIEQEKQ